MERVIKTMKPKVDLSVKIKRVCAYARVSSGKDSMLHSLSAQVSYYQKYIQSHVGWKFCGIYADEAETGTKESRKQFQEMLIECRKGRIDLVITKSISRFARNTITLLQTVRELKSLGVEVYFEEQNIFSLSTEGEVMLTILASYAQEESLSISENLKWRVKKNFEEGKPWGMIIYGYRCVDGVLQVHQQEAAVVKRIFKEFLSGKGCWTIAKGLNEDGIKPRKSDQWHYSSIQTLLRDYAYTGNLVLQKTYRKNHISKKSVKNTGELPMYHAMETHEAIISLEMFQDTQVEITMRADKFKTFGPPKEDCIFSGVIRCPYCGANYHRCRGGRVSQWRCATYLYRGKAFCSKSKTIPEDTLMKITTEIVGEEKLTGNMLNEYISYIDAMEGNQLVFHMRDGSTIERVWQDRSRAQSWTPEMRERVRQQNFERRKNAECQK